MPTPVPGETPAPWNRISLDALSPLIRAEISGMLILVKARFDQLFQFLHRLLRVRSFATDLQGRALASGQHHQTHNALAINLFAFFGDPHLAAMAAGNTDEHGGRTSVQPKSIHDRNFLHDLEILGRTGFSI